MQDAIVPSPRRIILCLDGTNNQPSEARTNVQRIYSMIARIPGRQITYYQPGVGTLQPFGVRNRLSRRLLMIADGATGWMMERHVCSAYQFLIDQYQEGDEIYLFGFSRGAQSARILAGMLNTVGLLHPGMREMVPFAWKMYTKWAPFRALEQLKGLFGIDGQRDRNREKRGYYRRASDFKASFGRPVRIKFMGLWDTVSAIGKPWDPHSYSSSDSNSGVDAIRHALSVDEQRMGFEPNLFPETNAVQDIQQIWFPGVHSDVGGGYAGDASDTAKISLAWMLEELGKTGIALDQLNIQKSKLPNLSNPNIVGKAACRSRKNEVWKPHWFVLECLPIPRWHHTLDGWRLRIRPHFFSHRRLPPGAKVHHSVRLRKDGMPDYRPANIPEDAAFIP